MRIFNVLTILLLFFCIKTTEGGYCTESYSCSKTCYKKETYTTRCALIFRCRRERTVSYACDHTCYRRVCCNNWTGTYCNNPICFGSTSCPNDGTCASPNVCSCPKGYSTPNCADINECTNNNGGCAHICTNNHGSFTCSCRSGYTLGPDQKGCHDINECTNNNGGCAHICTNDHGSFTCSCRSGYTLGPDQKGCHDKNECLRNNGGCQHRCVNIEGSFKCECDDGFILNSDRKTCRDYDECTQGSSSCEHLCSNTIGSYTCSCHPGYELALDHLSCEDVDECTVPTPVCGQQCHNTLGSYSCTCNEGYSLQNDRKTCTDIDECQTNNGNCHQECTNTQGSFTCSCLPGYKQNDDKRSCRDIDECSTGTSGCSHMCNNIDGSFMCSCPSGYNLDTNMLTCQDIDECEGIACLHDGTCLDAHLSYQCICASGFKGDHCESDIDECALLNGGCQEECTNVIGSYMCSCLDNRTLSSNGISCEGHSTSVSVFRKYDILGQGLPKGCYVLEMASCKSGETLTLFFSSTSEWYSAGRNIRFTYGIVFIEANNVAVPVSINGLQINDSLDSFQIQQGVSEGLEREHTIGKRRNDKCIDSSFSPRELFELIEAGSFLRSVFTSLYSLLPNWIEFKRSSTSLINVHDMRTELQYGHQLIEDTYCRGAPVFYNHLYSVFKFNTDFMIEIYGKAIHIPKTLGEERICLIIDICQNFGATIFLINPIKNTDIVSSFGTVFKNDLIVEARGIGISFADGINMTAVATSVEMWNGDLYFNYPISERGNVWLGGDYRMDNSIFKIGGEADIFFKIPDVINIFKTGYLDEMAVYFNQHTNLAYTLKFKLFGISFDIPFDDIVLFQSDMYMSLGGHESRSFCGKEANPPGLFISMILSINPFKSVPILKDWVFDNTHKVYLFLGKRHDSSLLDFSPISALNAILDLKNRLESFKSLLKEAFEKVKEIVSEQLRLLLQNIIFAISDAIETVTMNLHHLANGNIGEFVSIVNDIWENLQQLKTDSQDFLDTTELLVDVISDNITNLVRTEIQNAKKEFENVLQEINKQVGQYVKAYDGFGLKYHVTVKIFGLEIPGLDVEIVYSKTNMFSCSRFDMINRLLKDKEAVRFLARAFKEEKLGRFLKLDYGFGIGMAFAVQTKDVIVQMQVFANLLGTRATADLFIMKNKLALYTELNIFDIFLAQVDISAELGKAWYQLIFNVRGRFVANARDKRQVQTNSDSFQDSYLSALVKAITKISDGINERLSKAHDALNNAQSGLTAAQNWLEDKRRKLQKANVSFDNAIIALKQAQDSVEKAKGPFLKAMKKLDKAKKKVDNLCKIKTCKNICIPGVKCKICRKKVGWFRIPYPCCKFTKCMISIPNPICIAANIICRVVRAVAYAVLEAAKLVVRVVLIAFDIAKAALELAVFAVDKARVVLTVAEGILALAEIGLEGAKAILEIAKQAIEAIKLTIGLAFKVFEFVVQYGLKQIIDVRNCGFEVELSTTDLPVFDVFCEINAFKLGWKTVRLRINFKNIFQSIWQAAKATIKAIINGFSSVFGRRKRREIEFETGSIIHKYLRYERESGDDTLNSTQSAADDILDTLQYDEGFKYNTSTDYEQRVEIFRAKCLMISNVLSFMNESFASLFEIANDTYIGITESMKVQSELQTYNLTSIVGNITLENSDINPEYAFSDYNLTTLELETAISEGKNETISDALLLQILSTVDSVSDDIDAEMAAAESVQILNQWLLAMENTTNDYFNASECAGFRDCVYYAIYQLYDLYTEESLLPGIDDIQTAISSLEDVILEVLQNTSSSITETYNASENIKNNIHFLTTSNLFCSLPPVFLEMKTNVSTEIGSKISIHCNVDGKPTPTFSWIKNDQLLTEHYGDVMIIESAANDDEGIYRCIAGNVVANISSEDIYLYITDPLVTEPPDDSDTHPETRQVVYIVLASTLGFLLLVSFITFWSCHKRMKVSLDHRPRTSGHHQIVVSPVTNKTYIDISDVQNKDRH